MDRYLLTDDDPRGKKIYENIINNEIISDDYFVEAERNDNLEFFFDTTKLPLAGNSNIVKLKILNKLKKHKLDIYTYFDIVESYFNKYFYQLELVSDEEDKLNKYI
jgi:hypothetical protein